MKFYAGIGSRNCPENVCEDMTQLAETLNSMGYILRSGNAISADQSFAKGAFDKAQIWLPWKDFQKEFQEKIKEHTYITINSDDEEAFESVIKYHPNGKNLRPKVELLMARNYRQVIGKDEPDSEFVICWTPDGKDVGGTAQAIRIARDKGIPVYNLFNTTPQEILDQLEKKNLLY